MPFLAHKYQPLNVFFDLDINGKRNIYLYPRNPISFTITFGQVRLGELDISLFDESGFEIEPYLWGWNDQGQTKFKYQFGYTAQGGNLNMGKLRASDWYGAILMNYQTSIGRNSFTLSVKANGFEVESHLETGAISGTFHECINTYCERYGYVLEMDPVDETQFLEPDHSGKTTELRPKRFAKTNESDWQFIKKIVEQYAISPERVGGYTAFHCEEEGVQKLKVKRLDMDSIVDTYIVQDQDSVVIEWQPEINFELVGMKGAIQMRSDMYSTLTGEEVIVVADPHISKYREPKICLPVYTQVMHSGRDNQPVQEEIYYGKENVPAIMRSYAIRNRAKSAGMPTTESVRHFNDWLQQRCRNMQATLTIEGDPLYCSSYLNKRIRVIFYYPMTKIEHHTSGVYNIENITHNVSLGSYTTTFKLKRAYLDSDPIAKKADLGLMLPAHQKTSSPF